MRSEASYLGSRSFQKMRYPELREWINHNRPSLIWSACVLIQKWIALGQLAFPGKPLGSYESWTRVMGGILHAAGVEGFLKNLDKLYEDSVLEGAQMDTFLQQWERAHRDPVSTDEILPVALECEIPLNGLDDRARRVSLGMKLSGLRDRVVAGYVIKSAGKLHGAKRWKLERVSE